MADDTPKPNTMVPRVRDQLYREVYSNMSLTGMTPFDVTLTFQKASEVVPGQTMLMDQVAVCMSPQHFKAFVRSAMVTLEAYEASFGTLSVSDADTAPIKTADQIIAAISEARAAHQKAEAATTSHELRRFRKRSSAADRH